MLSLIPVHNGDGTGRFSQQGIIKGRAVNKSMRCTVMRHNCAGGHCEWRVELRR